MSRMNFSLFHKLADFICKDTGEKNESPKLIMILRILILSMLFYIAINSIIYISILNNTVITILSLSFLVFLGLFILSYRLKTVSVVCMLHGGMLLWIFANVTYLGWNTGVQHFILVLLVLCFFSSYYQYKMKIIYAFALCAFRIYLFFLCQNHTSIIVLDTKTNDILQITNTIAIFWCISTITYVFSRDSQNLESKLIEYNTQLIRQANTDALTGLYNRRRATEYMTEVLRPTNTSCSSVCICDIDFFKKVNDKYGHDIGDVVLQKISHIMKTTLEGVGFVARWGGEEFLIIFPGSNGDEANFLLGKLRNKIKMLQIDGGSEIFSITMTFGLAEYDFKSDIDSIIKEADQKLYLGKKNGRDQIVY